jgi:3-carboxy-cis,cis-muconate cycloisomerase
LKPVLWDGIYARGDTAAQVSDAAWLQAMLDVEAALAVAVDAPADAARQIADACRAENFDVAPLAAETARNATPVVGLVAALRDAVPESVREYVHAGATSQDIVDTALMLVARRALEPLLADARAAADHAAALARDHRHTPMIGRTLLQQALPTTFGLRAAGWLVGIDEACARLANVRSAELAVQMGGPVGGGSPRIAARLAAELGLAEPVMPWGAIRVRPANLATALGTLAGVLSKVARDVTLFSQQEVAEVAEGEAGGSSAMAHKRNPVAAVSTLACTERVPGLVAAVLGAMEQEHERAAGAWQSEWGTHTELLALTGSAAAWTETMLGGLHVDGDRMAANLAASPTADHPLPDGIQDLIDRALAAHAAA